VEVQTATTADGSLLRAVRETLSGAHDARLCVAFASEQGVHLLGKELKQLGDRAQLLVTTTFGTTTSGALRMAQDYGVAVGVLNPGGGTYHPKLYVGRHGGGMMSAVIGSANMTGGLISNVEVAVHLRGHEDEQPLAEAWSWAGQLWTRKSPWTSGDGETERQTTFDPVLYELLRAEVAKDRVFPTLGRSARPNEVTELVPTGLYVQTARSASRGTGAQFIPAWMFELAWDALRTQGTLANSHLLNDLRVHRSSAVCAILGRLPCAEVVPGVKVVLRWRP
jgi:HKD family nuclease